MSEPKKHDFAISPISNQQAVSTAGEARQAGRDSRKGWFHRFLVGKVPQRGHPGKFAFVEKLMKRVGFGNWYSEKVIDADTGEVIHECNEPFDQHQGHGSAKFKSPQSK
jgi:hypothetical protein